MRKCLFGVIALAILVMALAGCVELPEGLYMYAVLHDGNLKGTFADARAGANAIAYAGRPNRIAGATNHAVAFISINASDCIANIPTNFGVPSDLPIYNSRGTVKIGDNWADLVDGSPDAPLADALEMLEDYYYWWSGSYSDGTYNASCSNCSGWTSNVDSETNVGAIGSKNNVADSWMCIASHKERGNAQNYVLCIAWRADE